MERPLFPDQDQNKTMGMIIHAGDGVWNAPAIRPSRKALTLQEIIHSVHEGMWTEVMDRARANNETHAEVELGDPSTASGREFYAGCKKYLTDNGFEFEEASIPASGTTSSRLIARIKL